MSFSMLQRHVLRNGLWLSFLVIFFVTGLFAGKAWAAESKPKPVKVAPAITVSTTTSTTSTSTSTTTTTTLPAITTTTTPKLVTSPPVASNADWVSQCHLWAAEAGIELPPAAIKLIERESSCRPDVMNHGGSGAGGIPQALPYTKMGCSMDAAGAPCQLLWMLNYVNARYGGWDGAWEFWNCIGMCRGIHKVTNWY